MCERVPRSLWIHCAVLSLQAGIISTALNITVYTQCEETELPAQNVEESELFTKVVEWYKGSTLILRYLNTSGVLLYQNGFDSTKYSVNNLTVGLIIKNVTKGDQDSYVRLTDGKYLEISLTVKNLTSDVLYNLITLSFNRSNDVMDGVTEQVKRNEYIVIAAGTSEFSPGSSVELSWNYSTGSYTINPQTPDEIIPNTSEIDTLCYAVKALACGVTSDHYNLCIEVYETTLTWFPATPEDDNESPTPEPIPEPADAASTQSPTVKQSTTLDEVTSIIFTTTADGTTTLVDANMAEDKLSSTINHPSTAELYLPNNTPSTSSETSSTSRIPTTSGADDGNEELVFLAIPGGIIAIGVVIGVIYVVASSAKTGVTGEAAYSPGGYQSGPYQVFGAKVMPYYGEYEYTDPALAYYEPATKHGRGYQTRSSKILRSLPQSHEYNVSNDPYIPRGHYSARKTNGLPRYQAHLQPHHGAYYIEMY